jgi:hypothetical protein
MKKIFLTMAAASALAVSAPAAAQYLRHDPYAQDGLFQSRADQIEARINEAARSGALTPYQTAHLRDQLWQLQRLETNYSRNGLTDWERSDLRTRLADIDRQVGGAYGTDRDDRYDIDNNGYDDRTDRDGNGYDDLLDSDGNGYDDRYDRDGDGVQDRSPYSGSALPGDDAYSYGHSTVDGRYGDGRGYGQDDYDQDDDNSMLGDDRTSGDWDGSDQITAGPDVGSDGPEPLGSDYNDVDYRIGTLRVGDVAPADLGAVPPQLRGLYPDGNGVFYRYDDGQILQIQQSNNVIRWIGDLYR